MIPTLKLTLNPIFVLIIITHAQVFETIKKHGGQGYLAAPYYRLPLGHCIVHTRVTLGHLRVREHASMTSSRGATH